MKQIVTILLGSLILSLSSVTVFGQIDQKRMFYSVRTSMDFGRFQNRFEVSPLIGFRIHKNVFMGVGTTISYYTTETMVYQMSGTDWKEFSVKDQIWYGGGEVFVRYYPFISNGQLIRNLFTQISGEYLRGQGKYSDNAGDYKYATSSFSPLAGLGYKLELNEKINLNVLVNFNLIQSEDSPYRNPIIRFSFEI